MRSSRRFGFTLIEVLFAAFIISGALLLLAAALTSSSRFARAGDTTTHVVFAATEVIELETARIKTAGSPDLVCGTTTHTRQHNDSPYTVQITLAKLTLDPDSGELDLAVDGCAESEPDAYRLNLVLSWVQDGVSMAEAYQEIIATSRVRAPELDHFRAESGETHFLPAPNLPTTLEWRTTIGTQPLDVSITGSDGSHHADLEHTGTLTLAPARSTRYQFSISNSAGSQTWDATIFVDDIEVERFDASAPIVGPEEQFELRWAYTAPFDIDFERAVIQPGLGDVSGLTSATAGPIAGDTTFALLVDDRDNLGGPHRLAEATTLVEYSEHPIIDHYELAPARQCRAPGGNEAHLTWRVYAATGVTLNGSPVDREGGDTHALSDTTEFLLRAENALGVTSERALIAQVLDYPHVTLTGNGAPGTISIVDGTAAVLEWATVHATGARLAETSVPLAGTLTVEPLVTTQYELLASNQDLCDETATLLVTIEPIAFKDVTFDQVKTTEGDTVTLSWGYTNTLDPLYHRVSLTLPDGSEHDVTNRTSFTATVPGAGANQFHLRLHDRNPERVIAEARPGITAIPAPRIDQFQASSEEVCHSGDSVLSWITTNAASTRLIGIGSVPTSGSHAVTPTSEATYTLEASNRLGFTVQASVNVQVAPLPQIRHFRAAHDPVAFAADTHLVWNVTGADAVSIDQGVGSVTPGSGSAPIKPSGTTSYTLTATNTAAGAGCTAQRTAVVTVEAIEVPHFAGRFPGIPAKGRQIIEWEITPYIDPAHHRVRLTGPMNDIEVSHTDHAEIIIDTNRGGSTLPFTLTIYDRATGAVLYEAHTDLLVVKTPEIDELTVSPAAICKATAEVNVRYDYRSGASVLTWPDNPDGLFLGETFEPKIKGTRAITLTRSGEVKLTVTSMAGEVVEAARTVSVNPPPLVNAFNANRSSVIAGQATTLNWSVSGATSVTLDGESVPNVGSRDVYPLTDTTYTLRVKTPGCPTATRTVNVSVTPPVISQLSATPASIPPGGSASINWQVSRYSSSLHSLHLVGVGELPWASGNRSVSPGASTTYRLEVRARNAGGQVITSRTVTVNVGP